MTSMRPRCSVFIAASLDGFIARKDGGLDFLGTVQRDGEDYGYGAFASTVDALVVGRTTYDTVLGFDEWPYVGKRVVVMTSRALEPSQGEEPYDGAALPLLERLGREGVSRVYVDGGTVIRTFLAAGLIDDLVLSVVPVVLGEGVPLFGPGLPEQALALEEARPFDSGLVQLRYRVQALAAAGPDPTPPRLSPAWIGGGPSAERALDPRSSTARSPRSVPPVR